MEKNKNSVKLDNNPLPYFIGSLILIFSIIFVFNIWNTKNSSVAPADNTVNRQPQISASIKELRSHTWNWNRSEYKEEITVIENGENFQLTFNDEWTFNAKIDCNSATGTYSATDTGSIKMTLGAITEAFCGEDSADQDFIGILNAVQDYRTYDSQLLQLNMPASGPEHFFIPNE